MAVFERGEPIANGCLDIGGRLLRFEEDDSTVHSFSQAMRRIARDAGVPLAEGTRLSAEETDRLARRMAQVLEEAAGLRPRTPLHDALCVEACLPDIGPSDIYTFSGGVSECIYGTDAETARFHDLGAALGRAVASSRFFAAGRVARPAECSYATVIGAGAYSVAVSGSTICYQGLSFPLPALPTGKVPFAGPEDLPGLEAAVREQYRIFDGECAICMDGVRAPSYALVEQAAQALARAMAPHWPKVVILREDMAKALGQALMRAWPKDTPFLCMDGIALTYGDTVDIGAPLSGGRVIPVIVKTLAFAAGR